MTVHDIIEWTKEFFAKFPSEYEVQDGWHFNRNREEHPPFYQKAGVYLYVKPCSIDERSQGDEVLYIGKARSAVNSRIWSHMGLIFDPITKEENSPRFAFHRWADKDVPEEIKNHVATGNISVCVIRVENQGAADLPEALEKYLLACFYAKNKRLPTLNAAF